MSETKHTPEEKIEELEWHEKVPNLNLVEDLNPELFNFTGKKIEPEEVAAREGNTTAEEVAKIIGDKLDEGLDKMARAIEESTEEKAEETTPIPARIVFGVGYYIKRIAIALVVVLVGSVIVTYLANVGGNPGFTIGDALNLWFESIYSVVRMIWQ